MIAVLLACATPPRWTDESALAPTLHALDTDADGVVSANEFEGVRHRGRAFSEIDANQNGALDSAELAHLFFRSDPTVSGLGPEDGNGKKPRRNKRVQGGAPPAEGQGPRVQVPGRAPAGAEVATEAPPSHAPSANAPSVPTAPTEAQRRVTLRGGTLRVLLSLREELVYAGRPAPSVVDIRAAVDDGSLYTARARALLASMEAEAASGNIPFPPSLGSAALAARPVDAALADPVVTTGG